MSFIILHPPGSGKRPVDRRRWVNNIERNASDLELGRTWTKCAADRMQMEGGCRGFGLTNASWSVS